MKGVVYLKRIICFVLVVLMLSGPTFAEPSANPVAKDKIETIECLMNLIKEKYYKEVSDEKLFNDAVRGIMQGLDSHSKYYTQEELNSFIDSLSGGYAGIGMAFQKRDEYLEVVTVFRNSPAERSGIRAGCRVYSIDGESVEFMSSDTAAQKIKGQPGTSVKLEVDFGDESRFIDVVREEIKLEPGRYEVKDGDIGYIKIEMFSENAGNFVRGALRDFDERGINKIVIDLRDNTGGILEQAVEVARFFIPRGVVVSIKERGKTTQTYSSELDNPKYKLAVLVNEMSASASEVFAGAVQDRRSGTVIGTKTYGKGTVQKIYHIDEDGAVKLTISNYYTPNGREIDGKGITPDILIGDDRNGIDVDSVELLTVTVKPDLGDEGIDVYNAEKMLRLAGYDVDMPDMKLDEKTFEAIKQFQKDSDLGVYGRLDFTTQKALNKKFEEIKNVVDMQLYKAIEILRIN